MQNQHYLPIKKKQCNLWVRFEPFPLLEFSPPLESCSDIYAGPTSCLIETLLFNVLFLWYFPLFYLPVISIHSRSANIRPVHSNWALSSAMIIRHAPLLLIGCKCVLGHGPTLRSKAFFQKLLSAPLRSWGELGDWIRIVLILFRHGTYPWSSRPFEAHSLSCSSWPTFGPLSLKTALLLLLWAFCKCFQ